MLRDHRAIGCCPPIFFQESRHHPVTAGSVPDKPASNIEYARELGDHPAIVSPIGKESEGSKEIQDCLEA